MRRKKCLTILEVVIVIFLITLVTGAIGYNMKGTLDRGRAFKTEQAKNQLGELLHLCLAEGVPAEELEKDPTEHIKKLHIAKNPQELVKDGWGKKFTIKYDVKKDEFSITSKDYQNYKK